MSASTRTGYRPSSLVPRTGFLSTQSRVRKKSRPVELRRSGIDSSNFIHVFAENTSKAKLATGGRERTAAAPRWEDHPASHGRRPHQRRVVAANPPTQPRHISLCSATLRDSAIDVFSPREPHGHLPLVGGDDG